MVKAMDSFAYRDGQLYCEGLALRKIASEVGTPAYVYSSAAFKGSLSQLSEAFRETRHLICYSVKASSNLSLIGLAANLGCGADIVSGGELYRALRAGIPAGRVVSSGVGKTAGEMKEALEAGILMFNCESLPEAELLSQVAADCQRKAHMSFRVNPDVDPLTHPYVATGLRDSKFGLPWSEALEGYRQAREMPGLSIMGLTCHIGSQLTSLGPFSAAAEKLRDLSERLKPLGLKMRYLDMGGGLGIRYRDEDPPEPARYAKAIIEAFGPLLSEAALILEPGRSVAGNSAVLLIKALYQKSTPGKRFVVTDGAMSDLIRPSLYGSYHQVVPVEELPPAAPLSPADLVGPVCESGDFLAKDRDLPQFRAGDLIAVKGAGAYGFSMSSNYNSRPRAAEVLVEGDSYRIIRARESYEDLVRGEAE
jgi:diaminopimelate decarboxylase